MNPDYLLPSLKIIRVTGEDSALFLHNQLSNDIKSLAQDEACLVSYNTPQGRVIANMIVLNTGDSLLLVCSTDLAEAVAKRLKMFVLRSKVVFEENTEYSLAIADKIPSIVEDFRLPENPPLRLECTKDTTNYNITLPNNNHLFICQNITLPENPPLRLECTKDTTNYNITLPNNNHLFICQNITLPENPSIADQWQQYNIANGFAWINAENSATCVAQMLNYDLWGAVSFKKGCYPGQEIIARAHFRGQVKRAPAYYICEGAIPTLGEKITDGKAEAGVVVNAVNIDGLNHLLCVVKYDLLTPEHQLSTTSGSLLTLKQGFDYRDREKS